MKNKKITIILIFLIFVLISVFYLNQNKILNIKVVENKLEDQKKIQEQSEITSDKENNEQNKILEKVFESLENSLAYQEDGKNPVLLYLYKVKDQKDEIYKFKFSFDHLSESELKYINVGEIINGVLQEYSEIDESKTIKEDLQDFCKIKSPKNIINQKKVKNYIANFSTEDRTNFENFYLKENNIKLKVESAGCLKKVIKIYFTLSNNITLKNYAEPTSEETQNEIKKIINEFTDVVNINLSNFNLKIDEPQHRQGETFIQLNYIQKEINENNNQNEELIDCALDIPTPILLENKEQLKKYLAEKDITNNAITESFLMDDTIPVKVVQNACSSYLQFIRIYYKNENDFTINNFLEDLKKLTTKLDVVPSLEVVEELIKKNKKNDYIKYNEELRINCLNDILVCKTDDRNYQEYSIDEIYFNKVENKDSKYMEFKYFLGPL